MKEKSKTKQNKNEKLQTTEIKDNLLIQNMLTAYIVKIELGS